MADLLMRPKASPRGGVLALHAWWGMNDFFRKFCKRLANEGYLVLAPDLYNGGLAKTIPEADKLSGTLKRQTTARLLLASLKQLRSETSAPVGLVGFSLGAWWGLWLVQEKPKDFAATVLFYGARGGEYSGTKSAFLGHFAETDEYVTESGRKKMEKTLKAAGRETAFHVYPGTRHWFFEQDRPEYNAEAAGLAWKRSLEFLNTHLGESK